MKNYKNNINIYTAAVYLLIFCFLTAGLQDCVTFP